MRLGHVIGKLTPGTLEPVLRGGRFLLLQPLSREQFAGAPLLPLAKGSTLVAYDELGADVGHIVGFTEGAEASAPFPRAVPVDAYVACLVEQIHYSPPAA